jgi:TRAP-type mannitol/chloroaromatic compound transport system permease large subunit
MELAILMGVLFALLVLGVPVAFALLGASIACFVALDIPLVVVFQRMAAGVSTFSLMAIPFFVFAGDLMYRAGIAGRLVQIAEAAFGRSRGGLGLVTVGASTLFGAVSGLFEIRLRGQTLQSQPADEDHGNQRRAHGAPPKARPSMSH